MIRVFQENDLNTIDAHEGKFAVLTESGIQLSNGEVINKGKVVEIAREAQRFLEADDVDGYMAFLRDKKIEEELDPYEQRLLWSTAISGGKCAPCKFTALHHFSNFENDKILGYSHFGDDGLTEEEALSQYDDDDDDEGDDGEDYDYYDETCKFDLSKVWDYKDNKA